MTQIGETCDSGGSIYLKLEGKSARRFVMATKTKKRTLTKKQSANSPRNPINWVEVPVTDLERAKSFYGSVFGFKFELVVMNDMKMAFFPSKPDGWGCGGSLMQSDMYKPSHEGPMVYFPVADIEQTLT